MAAENNKEEPQDIARMSIPVSQEEYDLIKRAAAADGGRSVASFVRALCLPAAEQMIRRLEQKAEAA